MPCLEISILSFMFSTPGSGEALLFDDRSLQGHFKVVLLHCGVDGATSQLTLEARHAWSQTYSKLLRGALPPFQDCGSRPLVLPWRRGRSRGHCRLGEMTPERCKSSFHDSRNAKSRLLKTMYQPLEAIS